MAIVKICRFWVDDGKVRYIEVLANETKTRFVLLPPYNCSEPAFDYSTFLPKHYYCGSGVIKYPKTKAEAYEEFAKEMFGAITNANKRIREYQNLLEQAEKMFMACAE